ncbi:MAG: rRNA pseudouridine synthase [Magnetococcales bacterium]|nr:rRNA pseudouridine synthase [Magnetococcales bacterium]
MTATEATGTRLQKWLAEAGLCSRREGEVWIRDGRVAINGTLITEQGVRVQPGDVVAVDGQPVQRGRLERLLLALNKPPGVICTRHDPEGRQTVFDLLDPNLPRLVTVGRLDYLSEGMILLTNDGLLAHRLMHPRQAVERVYRVRVHGRVSPALLAQIQNGVELEDGPTGPLAATLDHHAGGANSWLTLTLREGRNHLVRRIFAAFSMEVSRLIRIAYGGVTMGELPLGRWRLLDAQESLRLRKAAGFRPNLPGAPSGRKPRPR